MLNLKIQRLAKFLKIKIYSIIYKIIISLTNLKINLVPKNKNIEIPNVLITKIIYNLFKIYQSLYSIL